MFRPPQWSSSQSVSQSSGYRFRCQGSIPALPDSLRSSGSETNSVVYWSEFLATDLEVWVLFQALCFLRSSGSGTGSTQPSEYS
jgi:hypothetical protein